MSARRQAPDAVAHRAATAIGRALVRAGVRGVAQCRFYFRASAQWRGLAVVVVLALSAALGRGSVAFAQAAGQWKGPEHIWNSSCGYCHGAGVGRELRGLKLPVDAIRLIVRRGSSGMPIFHRSELSDADLSSLAQWLAAAPAPPAPPAPASPSSP